MTNFKDLAQLRRSHRKFTNQEIDADDVKLILRAALMAPTSKGQRAWQFVVVDDPLDIEKLSDAKDLGSQFMKGAPLAVVVLGDPLQNDCWVEDGSIAAISDTVIRGILDIPENMSVLCVIAFGHKADERKPQNEDKLKWENVHLGKYCNSHD